MKKTCQIVFFICFILLFSACGISESIGYQPNLLGYNAEQPIVVKHSDSLFSSGSNYLIQNKQKLWELYVAGDPLQIGLLTGALSEHLVQKQEKVFFSKIQELVPSKFKQKLLRQFLKWYNRKMYLHVTEEYKTEIYGISQYTSNDYNAIAPNYLRSLYLHGAHDIGHALQDLALVGCSSMAVWGNKTPDQELLIGRNFDFYAGDAFAQDKIIAFVKPNNGYPFMSVTWGGMIGVVSGMNLQGLTVTLNAGKSKIPLVAKTPISIVAREILQYASTIEEAVAIAQKRKVFVSESIMVGSAKDKTAVLIEIAPDNFGVFQVQNSSQLICANHFQSSVYQNDINNKKHIQESHSQYRFERMKELLSETDLVTPEKMVAILRNKEGHKNRSIGLGNEKSLNQLLAHHGIVFKPESKTVWVSSNPYQLGEFVAYDLNKIFADSPKKFVTLGTTSLYIPKDDFLNSTTYFNYENYRFYDKKISEALTKGDNLSSEFWNAYQKYNPDYWEVYYKAGKYYYTKKYFAAAEIEFKKALSKEISTLFYQRVIQDYLKKIKRKRR